MKLVCWPRNLGIGDSGVDTFMVGVPCHEIFIERMYDNDCLPLSMILLFLMNLNTASRCFRYFGKSFDIRSVDKKMISMRGQEFFSDLAQSSSFTQKS